jgi:hypothetical protein
VIEIREVKERPFSGLRSDGFEAGSLNLSDEELEDALDIIHGRKRTNRPKAPLPHQEDAPKP